MPFSGNEREELVGVTLLPLMSVTPASAAPREMEYFCFEQAQQATLPLRPRGAWEAFMANCIANLTPTPTKKHNYPSIDSRCTLRLGGGPSSPVFEGCLACSQHLAATSIVLIVAADRQGKQAVAR